MVENLRYIIGLLADILGYSERKLSFYMVISEDKDLSEAVMKESISFYENNLKCINALPDSDKPAEQERIKKLIFISCTEKINFIADKIDNLKKLVFFAKYSGYGYDIPSHLYAAHKTGPAIKFLLESKEWIISDHDYFQLSMDCVYNGLDDITDEEAKAIYKDILPDESLLDRQEKLLSIMFNKNIRKTN